MAAGDTLQGRRLPDAPAHETQFAPGDYMRDPDGLWHIRPPRGSMGALDTVTDKGHRVEEHDDGTITVYPSIDLPSKWHGWLERGVWREV